MAGPQASPSLPFWPHAVAVAAALVALGYWTGRVRAPATPAEPSVIVPERGAEAATKPVVPQAQVNVAVFILEEDADKEPQQLWWPEPAPFATFVFRLNVPPPREEYALKIRAADGALVLSAEGLQQTKGVVTIAVPRQLMRPGRYAFELFEPGPSPKSPPLEKRLLKIG